MATVVNKSDPAIFQQSAATQNFPAVDWLWNPPGFKTLYGTVESKYWKLTGDGSDIEEMTGPEKIAVDTAIASKMQKNTHDSIVNRVDGVMPTGVTDRSLIQSHNKRDNYIVTRLLELQSAMDAMKASSGAADNLRAAIPSNWSATKTRALGDAVKDYKDDVTSGVSDDPTTPTPISVV